MGLIIVGVIFTVLALVAIAAVTVLRASRFALIAGVQTAAQARSESGLLIMLCAALLAISLLGAGVMAWVGAQVARQHPHAATAAAPLTIALVCLLVAAGCALGIAQERRRIRPRPPENPA